MAVSMRKQIAQNKRNTILIMLVFIAFIALIGWLFAWLHNDYTILAWFIAVSAGYALFQYAKDAKLPMPRVYIINDSAPNAFATGRNPEHASVAATTGLLDVMDDRELRAVMGHEMSHVKNYDIRISMITFGLVSLVGFIADFGIRVLFYSDRDEENNSPIGALFVLVTLILSPIVASLAQMGISRQREYLADASSAALTGDPDSMIDALRALDEHARPMRQQNVASEAMYIANPLRKSVLSRLFSTHPPIESRIERLENSK